MYYREKVKKRRDMGLKKSNFYSNCQERPLGVRFKQNFNEERWVVAI